MSPKFPAVTSGEVIRVITKIGFRFKRQAGTSHFRESDKRRTTVPVHSGKAIKRKSLKSILFDIGLTVEEFRELLHK